MPYTLAGDVEIYWESHSQGEPLLLISGVSGGTWSWEESIKALSPYFRIMVFDNMGGGRSTKPDRTYRIGEMADHAAGDFHPEILLVTVLSHPGYLQLSRPHSGQSAGRK